ncbi:DUF2461 domain-containing protein [Hymenobacter jejuensis]|uniref:DUF2461 domain-containing protein n=1 Tax=Hymenobacter jejuensis TaxID=2502781 RepID=A0A5B7ZW38_9BACT|nr:DUF2461 domain-containing protein [Hymenobacter jejuensis]QDA59188.1 DUF2461 domain-containing protein [Hymenobacter jejuensis]
MTLAFLLDFLRELAANNHKSWMDANRAEYHRARAVFRELVEGVLQGVQDFEPEMRSLTANDTMYRINKNDRFQQSDEPYKRHMGAGMTRGGRHAPWAGYFLAIEPGDSWIGVGKWHPESAGLARIRQEIHYNSEVFHQMRQDADLLRHFPAGLEGERLQRPPKGYDKNDPDLEWLKLKDFTVFKSFSDADVLHPDFVKIVVADLRAGQPLVQFLNQALAEE